MQPLVLLRNLLTNFQAGSEPRVKRDGRPALVKQKHSIQVTSISHTFSGRFVSNRNFEITLSLRETKAHSFHPYLHDIAIDLKLYKSFNLLLFVFLLN